MSTWRLVCVSTIAILGLAMTLLGYAGYTTYRKAEADFYFWQGCDEAFADELSPERPRTRIERHEWRGYQKCLRQVWGQPRNATDI